MSADEGAKKIFISHASNDPDWPETKICELATKLKESGAHVLLDYWHERDVVRGNLSPAEWREWMLESLDSSDHVLCLCTPRYFALALRDVQEEAGRGIAFEVSEMESRFYEKKQRNNRWCVLIKHDGVIEDQVIPRAMRNDCPRYSLSSQEDKLVTFLTGRQSVPSPGNMPAIPDADMSWPDDPLADQCDLVIERLTDAESFWKQLCRDKWNRRRPAALADREGFVRWLAGGSANDATDAMFATRRTLTACADGNPEIRRAAELAAVSIYCLAVCRLVDAQAVGEFYRFPKRAGNAAHLYCAVLATVLCGGRLELVPSESGRRPRSPSAYEIEVPAAADRLADVFEHAVYVALFPDDPDATEAALDDDELSDTRRSRIRRRIETIRQVQMLTPSLVVHVEAHCAVADEFSRKFDVPVFVCDPDIADALIGMTAKDLVADIEELWRGLNYCNRHAADEKNPDNAHTPKPA